MVFHHCRWPQVPQLTHPLRHTWPEVVMGNHIRTSAVHGKSFLKGLTKRSLYPSINVSISNHMGHTVPKTF